ncbi:Ig-like domain-containing protein [Streptomyces sp. H27-D2]|nr:Ig-like domain-containing protein [Streptomyces sp. H27-D2]MEC4016306.1 Ig-like domain-containing protein [Streptomyces sp. H27-D2]
MLALALGTALLVSACGGGGDSGGDAKSGGEGDGAGDKKASQAAVTIAPENGADDVATTGELKVMAEKGKLTSVKVADSNGNKVDGNISADGASWKPTGHLGAANKYTVNAVAKDSRGRASAKHSTFDTLVPKNTFIGTFTPENGAKVGVGMPVSVKFSRGITNPEDVRKALKVTASPSVPIEGHWFGNDRLDFRPEKYWAAGTKVTLRMNLDGVEGRTGVYGEQVKEVKFTVGRGQVSVVDAKSKKMTVKRDGKTVKTIPVTAGAPGTTTYNGKMVVSEKHEVTRMDGATVGFGGEYDIKDVPHAMRLSQSGTFIHGNYWSGKATFGSRNASHGCIGLFDARGGGDTSTPGAWFFNNSLVGDVVEVRNSDDETIAPENGFNGWNMSWADWTAK